MKISEKSASYECEKATALPGRAENDCDTAQRSIDKSSGTTIQKGRSEAVGFS